MIAPARQAIYYRYWMHNDNDHRVPGNYGIRTDRWKLIYSSNSLVLVDDAGDAGGPFAGALTLNGAGGSIRNQQCQVNGIGSAAVSNGNALTLTLSLTFQPAFAGNRILYIAGRDHADGNNTGWQAMGTWTVE